MSANSAVFGFINNIGPMELMIILGLGVLLFGKRLPEVGRSLGKGIVEFKKGLKGVEDDIEEQSDKSDKRVESKPVQSLPSDHKFDPYTGKPVEQAKFDPYTGKPVDQHGAEQSEKE